MIGKATLRGSIVSQAQRPTKGTGADREEPEVFLENWHRCKCVVVTSMIAIMGIGASMRILSARAPILPTSVASGLRYDAHTPPGKARRCPEYVCVSGAPPSQSERNGLFRQARAVREAGVMSDGQRPIFRSSSNQVLFYSSRARSWRIGNQVEGWQDGPGDSGISQDRDGASCPVNVSGWHVWNGAWAPAGDINVRGCLRGALFCDCTIREAGQIGDG